MSLPVFALLAAAIVLSALGVILVRNPVRSALCLVLTLFFLAVLFLFLDAHLVGALQIIVYTGAIMVLFLFVIMLLNLQTDPAESSAVTTLSAAGALCTLFVGILIYMVGSVPSVAGPAAQRFGTIESVAEALFLRLTLPFEITSVLMLVAIVGAVVLAKRSIQ
jgi:NADH-quinone oxidoreductase subunit J